MKTASVADIRAHLSEYLKASASGPVVVTRNGKAIAVLVGIEDDGEVEQLLRGKPRKLSAVLDAAERRIKQGQGISHEEFWSKVEKSHPAPKSPPASKSRRAKRGS